MLADAHRTMSIHCPLCWSEGAEVVEEVEVWWGGDGTCVYAWVSYAVSAASNSILFTARHQNSTIHETTKETCKDSSQTPTHLTLAQQITHLDAHAQTPQYQENRGNARQYIGSRHRFHIRDWWQRSWEQWH